MQFKLSAEFITPTHHLFAPWPFPFADRSEGQDQRQENGEVAGARG